MIYRAKINLFSVEWPFRVSNLFQKFHFFFNMAVPPLRHLFNICWNRETQQLMFVFVCYDEGLVLFCEIWIFKTVWYKMRLLMVIDSANLIGRNLICVQNGQFWLAKLDFEKWQRRMFNWSIFYFLKWSNLYTPNRTIDNLVSVWKVGGIFAIFMKPILKNR